MYITVEENQKTKITYFEKLNLKEIGDNKTFGKLSGHNSEIRQ